MDAEEYERTLRKLKREEKRLKGLGDSMENVAKIKNVQRGIRRLKEQYEENKG